MRLRLEYLDEEIAALREQLANATGTSRLRFTPEQRRRLAMAGKALAPSERRKCCHIVTPATILAWFRAFGARKYDSSGVRGPGRPRKQNDIRALVVRLATENPGWGYTIVLATLSIREEHKESCGSAVVDVEAPEHGLDVNTVGEIR